MRIGYYFWLLYAIVLISCSDEEGYSEINNENPPGETPQEEIVNFDLEAVPYSTLSEYNFYEGELKAME